MKKEMNITIKTKSGKRVNGKIINRRPDYGKNDCYAVIDGCDSRADVKFNPFRVSLSKAAAITIFPEISKIPGIKKVSHIDIAIETPIEEFNNFIDDIRKEYDRQVEIAMNGEIIEFTYEVGCDSTDTADFRYEFSEEICWEAQRERARKDEKLEEYAAKSLQKIKFSDDDYEEIEATLTTYGGKKFNKSGVSKILAQYEKDNAEKLKKERELEAKRQQKKEEREKLLAQAEKIEKGDVRYCGEDRDSIQKIDVTIKGKTYSFSARNIFDFGFIVNPNIDGGGHAVNVEEDIKRNYIDNPKKAETYRNEIKEKAPDYETTGWVWSQIDDNYKTITADELIAYKIAKIVTDIYKEIRM